jgi:hypothetical protein
MGRIPILFLLLWNTVGAATTPPPPQEPADFNHPPRQYEQRTALAWTVWVEKELVTREPLLCSQALARLEKKLGEMLAILPPATQTNFQQTPLFLMYGAKSRYGGRSNGAEYHQRHAPQHYSNLDPRMGGSVVVYSADNYVWLSEFWALKVLVHEFAHAHHLGHWPEEQPDILDAYHQAMAGHLYRKVLDLDGRTLDNGYAAVNQLEYFAELSCAYFVGCNYEPFNREQLKEYDPAGTRMIRKMWGLPPD